MSEKPNHFARRLLALGTGLALMAGILPTAAWAEPATAETARPVAEAEDFDLENYDPSLYPVGPQQQAPEWAVYSTEGFLQTYSRLPSKYDLREQGLATEVRDQAPFNSCWAFGPLSSLGSYLKTQGLTSTAESALSPHHLAWFGLTPLGTGSQKGEGTLPANIGSVSPVWGPMYHITAANGLTGMAALSAWQGAQTEVAVPYVNKYGNTNPPSTAESAANDPWALDESTRFDSAVHLTDASILPQPVIQQQDGSWTYDAAAVDLIKQAIMTTGEVSMAYYADVASPNLTTGDATYFNYKNWTSCVTNAEAGKQPHSNHCVSIVGWDDTIKAEQFVPGHQPAGDGAWIVKNSWGSNWGFKNDDGSRSGCFYLSYYDESANSFSVYQGDSGADGFDYQHNYQYDYLGIASNGYIRWKEELTEEDEDHCAANVFTAEGNEALSAVSAQTLFANATVKADVYKLSAGSKTPVDGVLVASTTDFFPCVGFHTLELETPILLAAGQRFSVVETITFDEGGQRYAQILVEGAIRGNGQQTVVLNPGESYACMGTDGWGDILELSPLSLSGFTIDLGNTMIKAFTNDAALPAPKPVESGDKKTELTGSFVETTPGSAKLTVAQPNAAGRAALEKALADNERIEQLLDLTLTGVDAVTGAMTVTFPAGTLDEGTTVSVLHAVAAGELDKTGKPAPADQVDRYDGLKVTGGKVSVQGVYSLSPFALVVKKEKSSGDDDSSPKKDDTAAVVKTTTAGAVYKSPKTGDESQLGVFALLAVLSLAGAAAGFAGRKKQ